MTFLEVSTNILLAKKATDRNPRNRNIYPLDIKLFPLNSAHKKLAITKFLITLLVHIRVVVDDPGPNEISSPVSFTSLSDAYLSGKKRGEGEKQKII